MTESYRLPVRRDLGVTHDNQEREFDFPYLKIPNGFPDDEPDRYAISYVWNNEPTTETLDTFFKARPDATERLIYCPQINVDETDGWGMFGYEPGYLFIVSKLYSGHSTLADETFLRNVMSNPLETPSGITIMQLSHYDFFPVQKYRAQVLKASDTPRTFAYISRMLNTPRPQ